MCAVDLDSDGQAVSGQPWASMLVGSLRHDRTVDVPAAVVAYDPRWPGLFTELRGRVDAALADVAHVTEHVGSTAVPVWTPSRSSTLT
jgi:GrpB-like predicted nucleotidyltransferase (UPF0157 family)